MKNLMCFSFMVLSLHVSLYSSLTESPTQQSSENVAAVAIGLQIRKLDFSKLPLVAEQRGSEDQKFVDVASIPCKPGTLKRTDTKRTMAAMLESAQQEDQ